MRKIEKGRGAMRKKENDGEVMGKKEELRK
jgi:hypothetical protein